MEKDKGDSAYVSMELFMELEKRVDAVEGVIKEIKGTLSQMDKRMTSEVCWPLLFIGIPW